MRRLFTPYRRAKNTSSNSLSLGLGCVLWLLVFGGPGTGGIRGALGDEKRCDVVIPTLDPGTTTAIATNTCNAGMLRAVTMVVAGSA